MVAPCADRPPRAPSPQGRIQLPHAHPPSEAHPDFLRAPRFPLAHSGSLRARIPNTRPDSLRPPGFLTRARIQVGCQPACSAHAYAARASATSHGSFASA
ncbi:hypothetical protein KRMM14A1259_65300 [Krasilnikovia sp. MM14-A1259]